MEENFSLNDIIYLVVDGEADESQRQALFNALGKDTELQAEFQDALNIKRSAEYERQICSPPVEFTRALFNKAGFSNIPNFPLENASLIPKSKKFWDLLFSKTSIGILSGICCSVLTYFAAMNFLPNDGAYMNAENISKKENILSKKIADISNSGISSEYTPVSNKKSSYGVVSSNSLDNDNFNKNEISALQEIKEINQVNIINSNNNDMFRFGNILKNKPELLSLDLNIYKGYESPKQNFLLELKGIYGFGYYPKRIYDYPASNSLNNISASALIQTGKEKFIGIACGNETFPLFLKNSNNEFQKRTDLFWIGIIYKQYFNSLKIFDTFTPYFQGSVSGTQSGPFFQPEIGLIWEPDSRVYFSLGGQGAYLVYQYNKQIHGTGKISFNYGCGIRF